MKSIELTKHVLDQVRVRKKLIWRKAEMFIEDKFKRMYKSPDKIVTDATRWLWKIRVGNEKIVYAEDKNSFTLITYIIKTEFIKNNKVPCK